MTSTPLATFEKLALSVIEPKYEHGSVWRARLVREAHQTGERFELVSVVESQAAFKWRATIRPAP